MTHLTQEYLKECFTYDPITGDMVWLERPRSHFKTDKQYDGHLLHNANKPVTLLKSGRGFDVRIDGNKVSARKLAYTYMTGKTNLGRVQSSVPSSMVWEHLYLQGT